MKKLLLIGLCMMLPIVSALDDEFYLPSFGDDEFYVGKIVGDSEFNMLFSGTPLPNKNKYAYIALTRTTNNIVTAPIVDLVSVGGGEDYFTLTKNMINLQANVSTMICDATSAGAIYYDNTLKKHRGCDGTNWNNLY